RDRRLPAQPRILPRLRARLLQRLRQAGPDHRPLRRQRPLRPRQLLRPQPLRLQRSDESPRTDRAERTVRRLRHLGRGQGALPRRRQPGRRRRLQSFHRTGLARSQSDGRRLQPGGRAGAMRRPLVIGALVAAVIAVGGEDENDGYVVRAIFDNGGFMVKGEQVRIAGANVGEIESVGVTLPGEVDSYEGGEPKAVSGKAVIVMKITDAGFQDFRADASCLIRPQSLIGEKFVDCRPTLPRAPGSPQAPALKKVPKGQPGGGSQYLLPL